MVRGDLARFLRGRGDAARRLRDAELPQQLREALAILGEVDRIRRGADDLDARFLQRQRQLQRRLPAELHDDRDVAAGFALARMIENTSSKVSGSKYRRSTVS